MEQLWKVRNKGRRRVIGLMSGTSVDGIDAALVEIQGEGIDSKVELVEFINLPFEEKVRNAIFRLFDPETCKVNELCHMNFLLGELFAKAAIEVARKGKVPLGEIDLIGSHGQTIYHIPQPVEDQGYTVASTLQIGEPAVIAERTGIITVADFRVRDMAAGGQGAPLVPYTEFILYRKKNKTVALQNIGGIGNVTVLPRRCNLDQVVAFDNGPGNMIIDEIVYQITKGRQRFDSNGDLAAKGKVNESLLNGFMSDPYLKRSPPKTTGREYFGAEYANQWMNKARQQEISDVDIISTVTAFTARAISESYKKFIIPQYGLDEVIIGGGGSYNETLVRMTREYLPGIKVITQEEIGCNSDAKEAIAFALLANETINGNCNNVPGATGAKKPVIMGKIIL